MKNGILFAALVMVGVGGCGGGGTSAVVEYNAAMESYDRESSELKKIREAIQTASGEQKQSLEKKAESKEKTLESLRKRAKEAESKL